MGQVQYDAVKDCAGADAWTCLARTVEEASYRRKVAGVPKTGGGGGGGDGSDLFEEGVEEDALEVTLMRCEFVCRACTPCIFVLRNRQG